MVAVIALQLAVTVISRAWDWSLWVFPWWVLLVVILPETALLISLVLDQSGRRLRLFGHRTAVAVALFVVISLANALLLVALVSSLLSGEEQSGGQLLVKGLIVWTTNAITFGLWFWSIDRGGPAKRLAPNPPAPDFLFPQMTDPSISQPAWHPSLFDYMYVSLTNSIAFSPTDTLPLTHLAKLLMVAEAIVSAFTVLLVVARAVNILK